MTDFAKFKSYLSRKTTSKSVLATDSIQLEKTEILFHSNEDHVTICSFNRRKSKISLDKVA